MKSKRFWSCNQIGKRDLEEKEAQRLLFSHCPTLWAHSGAKTPCVRSSKTSGLKARLAPRSCCFARIACAWRSLHRRCPWAMLLARPSRKISWRSFLMARPRFCEARSATVHTRSPPSPLGKNPGPLNLFATRVGIRQKSDASSSLRL
jgi:hypothetical protein